MIAFLFPGQGSQKVGMGQALHDAFSVCRETFVAADRALGEPLSRLCFEGPADCLELTENAQPAILTVSTAAYRLLASRDLLPAYVAGHSLGEYSAHVAAGTMAFEDAVQIVRRRGRYMQEAVPVGEGAMAAVLGLDAELVERACAQAAEGEVVAAANVNAPGQVVIAGARAAVARASAEARRAGAKRIMPLPVSAPFHCALMVPAQQRLEPELRALATADPLVPVVANVDAQPKRDRHAAIDALVRQVAAPVRWQEVIGYLASEGVRAYVEVGQGRVLGGLVRKIDPSAAVISFEKPEDLEAVEALFRTFPASPGGSGSR